MSRIVALVLLVVAIVGPARATVISDSCSGTVVAAFSMTGGTAQQESVAAPSCSADAEAHGQGALDARFPPVRGDYIGNASASYSSALTEALSSFILEISAHAEGSITMTSFELPDSPFTGADGGFGQVTGGFFAGVDATRLFSVDTPYFFRLDYSASGDAFMGLSANFFLGSSSSQGVLTGTLLPGQTYSMRATSGSLIFPVMGGAVNGETRTFTQNGGVSASLVAVPEPGTLTLLLGGGLLVLMTARRKRTTAQPS